MFQSKVSKRYGATAKASKQAVESAASFALEGLEVRRLLTVPPTPAPVRETASSFTTITLDWTGSTAAEDGFQLQRLINGQYVAVGNTSPLVTNFTDSGLTPATTYNYRLLAFQGTDISAFQFAVATTSGVSTTPSTPFGGNAAVIPGVIQAENFDNGGEGIAYHSSNGGNLNGNLYRTSGVTVEPTSDIGGGFDVGFLKPGDFLKYTISVPTARNYDFSARVANPLSGGAFQVELDGKDVSGILAVPNTGSYQTYTTVIAPNINMTAGTHVITLVMVSANSLGYVGNFNSFQFTNSAVATGTIPTAPTNLLATPVNGSSIILNWTDTSNNETGFNVDRLINGIYTNIATLGTNVTTFTDTGLAANTAYTYRVSAFNANGISAFAGPTSATTTNPTVGAGPGAPETPFGGVAVNIPGRIEAENFDDGGEGIGYHSSNPLNYTNNYYRTSGVSVENTGDAGGGFDVGFLHAGDFLNYTINVTTTGNYDFGTRVANSSPGATFHEEVDGANVTGSLAVPNTGGFQTYQTVTAPNIALSAGIHIVRLVFDSNSSNGFAGNVNYIQVSTSAPPAVPAAPTLLTAVAASNSAITLNWVDNSNNETGFIIQRQSGAVFGTIGTVGPNVTTFTDTGLIGSTSYTYRVLATNALGNSGASNSATATTLASAALETPFITMNIPGTTIEAENFDNGGEGIAYHSSNAQNFTSNYYRTSGVSVENAGDTGGGFDVGFLHAGDYMKYTINVTAAGNYDFNTRVANAAAGGTFHESIDGNNVTGTLAIPNTGGFQTYQTVTKSGISLTAGTHILTLAFESNSANGFAGNVNYITLTPTVAPVVPAAPVLTAINPISNSAITLTWSAVANVTGYVIERQNGAIFGTVGTVGPAVTTFTDTGLAANTSYTYRVRAVNAVGQSLPSNTLTAATLVSGSAGVPFPGPAAPALTLGTPVTIQAENFDQGAEGVAYHSGNAINYTGNYYRTSGVSLELSSDTGGTPDVGFLHAGDYMNYTVNATNAGVYKFSARVANSAAGGAFHVEVDGSNVTGSIAIPNTGGFQTYVTTPQSNLTLTAGLHVIRLVMDTNSANNFTGNFNYFQLT